MATLVKLTRVIEVAAEASFFIEDALYSAPK